MDKNYKNNYCRKCQDENILRRASFGKNKDKLLISCSEHKDKEMIDLIHMSKNCIECFKNNILKQATYGYNNELTHCLYHKDTNMNDNKNKNNCIECLKNKVTKRGVFGYIHNKEDRYCSNHKEKNMINLENISNLCVVCLEKGIFKEACYGYTKREYCFEHKKNDMNYLKKESFCIKCRKDDILKRANFGFLSDRKKVFCEKHKINNMVNLANLNLCCKTCLDIGLVTRSTYGYIKDKKLIRCAKHKENNMVDINNYNKCCVVCKSNNIFKRASCGKLFEKKIHCKSHSLPNEFLNNNPKCEVCKKEKPVYGGEKDIIPKRCEEHKSDTDVDLVSRECESCKLDIFIPSTQSKCYRCLNWNIKGVTNRGVKEKNVLKCLTQLSNVTGLPLPINDQKIGDGCSKRRPDFYYKDFTDTFSLVVEVDEHQHSRYSCSIEGEMRRIITLYEEDSGGFPLLFIRFNPDSYYFKEKVITSYVGRQDKLKDVIKSLKNRNQLDYPINVIYLFYDNFEEVKIEPLTYKIENGNLVIKHKHPLSLQTEHKFKL